MCTGNGFAWVFGAGPFVSVGDSSHVESLPLTLGEAEARSQTELDMEGVINMFVLS